MLSQTQNERRTWVGPGTPAGELLRRYWCPVSFAAELTAEEPTQFVRILGEALALAWKTRSIRPTPKILHQETANRGRTPPNTTRGFLADIDLNSLGYYEYPFGIMKQRTYTIGVSEGPPLIFPNILREGTGAHIRVPVDDTHTWVWYVNFLPDRDGQEVEQGDPPHAYHGAYKNPPDKLHPFTRLRMDRVDAQDYMVWETQGPIANRERERLAATDRGREGCHTNEPERHIRL